MNAGQESAKIGVGLCAELEQPGGGLDLEAIRRLLEESDPDVRVEVMPNVCRRPEQVPDLASRTGAARLVIGLCEGHPATHEFQSWTRRAGLDPYAVELLDLRRWTGSDGAPQNADDAILMLKAAIARLRAFESSEPQQLKLRFLSQEGLVSRRSLVTMPPWTYEAVPMIDQGSCLGNDRCGLCGPACPFEAISTGGDGIFVDKPQCEACGVCLTTCPANAIRWPGSSLAQYEAQMTALLSAPHQSLIFTCRQASAVLDNEGNGESPLPSGWLPIEVPCMGMVTPGWILQALAGGAARVALVGCGYGCRINYKPIVKERVAYLHEMLGLLGVDRPAERVGALYAEPGQFAQPDELKRALDGLPPAPGPTRRGLTASELTLAEPAATAQAVLKLAKRNGATPSASLAHDASPLGLVKLREETCTTCGSCAGACPTAALSIKALHEAVTFSYDPLLCINCGRCAPVCPEKEHDTLSVEGVTDLAALMKGRITLKHGSITLCKSCGGPVAPAAVLGKIQALLQDEEASEALLETVTELCSDCRGVQATGA